MADNTAGRAPVGLVAVAIGLALVATSIFALDWTGARFSDGGVRYFELPSRVLSSNAQQTVDNPSGFAIAYFNAVGVLLFVLIAALALAATWPGARRPLLRTTAILGTLAALAALAVSWAALGGESQILGGPVVALAGYLAVLFGAMVGPHR
ncbi:hypothetical protein ABZS66_60570 [Dactylosporangium sp. NPDC005572]|uniref:hypothetical protein n=1 Tax=Dactylosporangium sp. NPDC005572 TaxID=3156889 RepID=UPI0033BC9155